MKILSITPLMLLTGLYICFDVNSMQPTPTTMLMDKKDKKQKTHAKHA